eukprot:m.76772 g.76772  ORF g.76772 m.76772 type:complete len:344 (+) comp12499_c0_seq1:528-1559(+)
MTQQRKNLVSCSQPINVRHSGSATLTPLNSTTASPASSIERTRKPRTVRAPPPSSRGMLRLTSGARLRHCHAMLTIAEHEPMEFCDMDTEDPRILSLLRDKAQVTTRAIEWQLQDFQTARASLARTTGTSSAKEIETLLTGQLDEALVALGLPEQCLKDSQSDSTENTLPKDQLNSFVCNDAISCLQTYLSSSGFDMLESAVNSAASQRRLSSLRLGSGRDSTPKQSNPTQKPLPFDTHVALDLSSVASKLSSLVLQQQQQQSTPTATTPSALGNPDRSAPSIKIPLFDWDPLSTDMYFDELFDTEDDEASFDRGVELDMDSDEEEADLCRHEDSDDAVGTME